MRKIFWLLSLLLIVVALILSACSDNQSVTMPENVSTDMASSADDSHGQDGVCGDEALMLGESQQPWRFIVITHGSPETSKFWAVVKSGVDHAAKDMRVTVDYQAPQSFDVQAMAQMIRDAMEMNPDGLIVSIPDAEVLRAPIEEVIQAGVPVISINSGSGVAEQLGVLAHVGQTEYTAGRAAGEEMVKHGVTKGLCLIQEAGNTALEVRCQGFADALNAAGVERANLVVDATDPDQAQQQIADALAQSPDVDALLALGPSVGEPALAIVRDSGHLGRVKLAAFDLSPEMLEAVQSGEMLFLVDQQPYMQGYLPVMYLTQYKLNLSKPATKIILTGPSLITHENAAQVLELSKQGLR